MNTISQAHYYGSIPVSNITCQSLKDMLIGKVQCAENSRIWIKLLFKTTKSDQFWIILELEMDSFFVKHKQLSFDIISHKPFLIIRFWATKLCTHFQTGGTTHSKFSEPTTFKLQFAWRLSCNNKMDSLLPFFCFIDSRKVWVGHKRINVTHKDE